MSNRITSKGNHFPVLNVMKCSLNCLLVSYLSCSLLLTIVMAAPEVGPIDTQMGHKLHPNSNSAVSMDKRAAPRQYNFGIGKKSDYSADVMEDNSEDSDEGYGPDYNKRGAEQSR
ncbi:unnamed protein product [Medioppia subpectinata]|uniref:Uncharacterized protein n=1 Tax=Medioppia subpectinata TaxID=1979941 RepID=A0A7R9KYE2_9ACAR|nr:unnamed protein product [Medioppia subpectinata]CAG2112174.1 unnamed protein product [Medioppia subpectinata]